MCSYFQDMYLSAFTSTRPILRQNLYGPLTLLTVLNHSALCTTPHQRKCSWLNNTTFPLAFTLLLLAFFTSNALQAQNLPTSPYVSITQQCGVMVADAFSPIFLRNSAECYIAVNETLSTYHSDQLSVTDQFGGKYRAVFYKQDQYFHLSDLPLGRDFSVTYLDGCGKEALLGHFNCYGSPRRLSII